MPQLDLTTYASQLFWLSVTFLCLWAVMRYALLPSLQRVIGARKAHILKLVEEAKDLHQRSHNMREEQLRRLENTKKNHRDKVERAVSAAHEAIAQTGEMLTHTYRAKNKELLGELTAQYEKKKPQIEQLAQQAAHAFLRTHAQHL